MPSEDAHTDDYYRQYYEQHQKELKERSKKYYEEVGREKYEKSKESRYMQIRDRRRTTENWINSLKKDKWCNRCGETDFETLVFHHKDPASAEFLVIDGIHRGISRKKLLEEVEKCEIICANCHRKSKCPLVRPVV